VWLAATVPQWERTDLTNATVREREALKAVRCIVWHAQMLEGCDREAILGALPRLSRSVVLSAIEGVGRVMHAPDVVRQVAGLAMTLAYREDEAAINKPVSAVHALRCVNVNRALLSAPSTSPLAAITRSIHSAACCCGGRPARASRPCASCWRGREFCN